MTDAIAHPARGSDETDALIQYAYASSGTAFSDVVGQSVQAYRVPIAYTIRSLDDYPWGLKLTAPVSVARFTHIF